MTGMTWREFTRQQVEGFCHESGVRTFTLAEFVEALGPRFQEFAPANNNVAPKIRQTLQFLRNDGILTFVDGRGTYTLRNVALLRGEVEPDKEDLLRSLTPEKREYLVEVFARDRGWVALARKHYGDYCLLPQCQNTFLTEAGKPYIEVHHIVPLSDGGEEALWNLSVICAHHHRMAHFADRGTRVQVKDTLRSIVDERYARLVESAR